MCRLEKFHLPLRPNLKDWNMMTLNGKWTEMGATVRPDAGINPKVTTEVSLKRKVKASKIKVEIYTSHWIRINELEAVETHQFSAVK